MNKTTTYNSQKMRNAIMRRVWYTYVLSVAIRPSTAWGIAFGASVIGFWRLVSITSIVQNFLNVPIGQVPTYVLQSMMQAEFLALIAFGIIVFTLLSVGLKVTLPVFTREQRLSSV
ncbi:hypothetical protein K2P47_04045 [Patescibacteria group bacterium]|nr:hypothetical protein [Patescibacteria group bacterium]